MDYVECFYTIWNDCEYRTIVKGYSIKRRWYTLREDGMLFIRAGYPWDGPSGAMNTKDFVLPSLIHDILCELINEGAIPVEYQSLADEQMRITARTQEFQMPWYRRMYTYMAVRFYQINKHSKPARIILKVK